MRQGLRVIDVDTHLNPSLDVLLRYADPELFPHRTIRRPLRLIDPSPRGSPLPLDSRGARELPGPTLVQIFRTRDIPESLVSRFPSYWHILHLRRLKSKLRGAIHVG